MFFYSVYVCCFKKTYNIVTWRREQQDNAYL